MTQSFMPVPPAAIIAPAPAPAAAVAEAPSYKPLTASGQYMLFPNGFADNTAAHQLAAACAHELGKMLALVPDPLSREAALGIMTSGLNNGRAAEVARVPFAMGEKTLADVLFGVREQDRLTAAAGARIYGGEMPPVAVGYYLRSAMESVFSVPMIKAMRDDDELARTTIHGWVLGGFDKATFADGLVQPEQLATLLCESIQPRDKYHFLPLPVGDTLKQQCAITSGWIAEEAVLRGISLSQMSYAARLHAEAALFVAQHVLDDAQGPRLDVQRSAATAFEQANVMLQEERAAAAAARARLQELRAATVTWVGAGGTAP